MVKIRFVGFVQTTWFVFDTSHIYICIYIYIERERETERTLKKKEIR